MKPLCAICGITEADCGEPSARFQSAHSRQDLHADRQPCKWAKAAKRLYDYVRKGGKLEDLLCRFCLIPRTYTYGYKWEARHRRYDEPVCEPAADALRRASQRDRLAGSLANPEDTYYDKDGNLHNYDTMTHAEYMAARG